MDFEIFVPQTAGIEKPCAAALMLKERAVGATAAIQLWQGYSPSPLIELSGLAGENLVASISMKDEAKRFGLGSFKALGGAYAISKLLERQSKYLNADLSYLLSPEGQEESSTTTVCCATDGNHGRSVAWGAKMFGCGCVIFIHATVSEERKAAIESYGAHVVRTDGNYDDSVRAAQEAADIEGWTVVSDTSYEGYRDIPMDVMAGYSIMATEAIEQWPQEDAPTHVFLQTGVGSMAAAVVVQMQEAYGEHCPKIILCDPENAACWFDSLTTGSPQVVGGNLDTIMAGLACGEVSQLAWEIMSPFVHAVIKINDEPTKQAMRLLAGGNEQDEPLVAGESGVGGLAGFLALANNEVSRDMIDLNAKSRVLFFSTEGATDQDMFMKVVGKSPDQVTG